ncbi:MAG TPA: hypothetical protein VJ888_04195 [Mobilitalea sp.]|nr:hypothetical protein [Mobilitalea sp.]
MERTIGRIFEIDEKAKLIIDRANEEKIKLHDEFEEDIAKLEEEINNDNAKKIYEYQINAEKELESEKKTLTLKSEKQLLDMDELYKNSHSALVDKVLEGIIGGR